MTIVVFLVDTSASMNQLTDAGMTFLDTAKSTIEMFLKMRSKDPACRFDFYVLLTSDDPPMNIKARWGENQHVKEFMKELKSLEAGGLSDIEAAAKNTFLLLNAGRLKDGVDHYCQGRFPFRIDQRAIIICLTDGDKLTQNSGASEKLRLLNESSLMGSELTSEPYRWDQKWYNVIYKIPALQIPSNLLPEYLSNGIHPTEVLSEATGGQSYIITNREAMIQCLDSLTKNMSDEVVVDFEKMSTPCSESTEDSFQIDQSWIKCKGTLKINKSAQGHWPIPECYWPDVDKDCLPPRPAHPLINFSCRPCKPLSIDIIPFDKYELAPSPLTEYILKKEGSSVVWQVFMRNSSKFSEMGHPFGYLKASPYLNAVNLYVMPYNYPHLFALIEELKIQMFEVTPAWKMKFDEYIKSIPPYYVMPLKKAFLGIGKLKQLDLIKDQVENYLSPSVVNYLKNVERQAGLEVKRLWASAGHSQPAPSAVKVVSTPTRSKLVNYSDPDKEYEAFLVNYENFKITTDLKKVQTKTYTNPFAIDRNDLLSSLSKLRLNFLSSPFIKNTETTESLHSQPISDMSNYEEHLKRQVPPLRQIEATAPLINPFGSPYKRKKCMMIDETDEVSSSPPMRKNLTEQPTSFSSSPRSCKRKRGPISRFVPTKVILLDPAAVNKSGRLQNEVDAVRSSIEISRDFSTKGRTSLSETVARIESISTGVEQPRPNIPEPKKVADKSDRSFEDIEDDVEQDDNVKKIILASIRRKGNFNLASMEKLESLRGSATMKRKVIDRIEEEAFRFKRRAALKLIRQMKLSV